MVATQDRPRIKDSLRINALVRITSVQSHQSKNWIGQTGTIAKIGKDRIRVTVAGMNGGKPIELPLPPDCLELVNDEPVQAFKIGDLIVGKTATDQVAFGRYKGISPSGLLKVDTGRRTNAVTPESAVSVEMPKFAVADRVLVNAQAPMWVGVEAKIAEISSQPEYQKAIDSWVWQWRYLLHGKSHTPENPEHSWMAECHIERLAAAIEAAPEPSKAGFEVGDRVYFEKNDQKVWKISWLDDEKPRAKLEDPLLKDSTVYAELANLKRWEFKYCPGQWVKVRGEMYHQCIVSVVREAAALQHHFRTEPDDGLKHYRIMFAPWLDKETDTQLIAESDIEYHVLEPVWMTLDDGDRVAFCGNWADAPGSYISGTLIDAYSLSDTLEVEVLWDSGKTSKIQLQELLPFDLFWRVGDRVTEDINTENAYSDGWASEQNRTHGTIAYFEKSGDRFNPKIRKADGSLCLANPQCLQPYAGGEPLPEPKPAEPLMTAEQVMEEMERAMRGEESENATDNNPPAINETRGESITLPLLPTTYEIEAAIKPNDPKRTIEALLSKLGFRPITGDDFYPDGEPEPYRGWQINTESHEGALMAVSISDGTQWLSLPSEADDWFFGYKGHQQAIDWAKRFVDCLIEVADKASGQLSLLEGADPTPLPKHLADLSQLATDINQLHNDCEQAVAIAQSAQQSALEHAKEAGLLLLQAKRVCGHGKWEAWREANLQLPSSTATLYQRVAEGWEVLTKCENFENLTLKEAANRLKKPRLSDKSATDSQTVAEMKPTVHEKDLTTTLARAQADFHQRKAAADARAADNGSSIAELQTVPQDQIASIAPSGWIQTKDGQNLNPMHYKPEAKGEGSIAAVLTGYDATTGAAKFNLVAIPEQPTQEEVDKANWGHLTSSPLDRADSLKWLDAEFEQSIELVTEWLGPDQIKKMSIQIMQDISDLGGLPVAILAVKGCDRDELLQIQEIVKRMLEDENDD